MPYNPGIQYQGGQLLSQGLQQFGAGIGKGLEKRAERQEELKKNNKAAKGMRMAMDALGIATKDELEALDFEGLKSMVGLAPLLVGQPLREIQNRAAAKEEERDEAAAEAFGGAMEQPRKKRAAYLEENAGGFGPERLQQMIAAAGAASKSEDERNYLQAQIGKLDADAKSTLAKNLADHQALIDKAQGLDDESKKAAAASAKDIWTDPAVREWNLSRSAYENLVANLESPSTGVSDLSHIFTFMKSLDPASAVRGGEFELAEGSSGALKNMLSKAKGLVSGERLSNDQRAYMVEEAEKAVAAKRKSADTAYNFYLDSAIRRGISRDLFPSSLDVTQPPAQPPAQPENDPTSTIPILRSQEAAIEYVNRTGKMGSYTDENGEEKIIGPDKKTP